MNWWITSDKHLRHKNICRGTSEWEDKSSCRDFDTLDEMNECIIDNCNSLVREDDFLIEVGDFAFGDKKIEAIEYFRKQIRCKNILFLRGNHDPLSIKNKEKDAQYLAELSRIFGSPVIDYRVMSILGKLWVIQHYCQLTWLEQNHNSLHCFGHSHGGLKIPPGLKCRDIGIDTNHDGFYPFSLEAVRDELVAVQRIAYDHH